MNCVQTYKIIGLWFKMADWTSLPDKTPLNRQQRCTKQNTQIVGGSYFKRERERVKERG